MKFKIGDKLRCKRDYEGFGGIISYKKDKIYYIDSTISGFWYIDSDNKGHGANAATESYGAVVDELFEIEGEIQIKEEADYYKWLANR